MHVMIRKFAMQCILLLMSCDAAGCWSRGESIRTNPFLLPVPRQRTIDTGSQKF